VRVTRPPFGVASFRWLYLAWVCLLVSSSVWTLSRDPRFSAEEAGADNYTRLAFLGLGVLVILAVAAVYRFAFFSELWRGALGIFFLFSLWGLASTAWSVSPAGTFYKASEYCAMLALFALTASLINLTLRNPKDRIFVEVGLASPKPTARDPGEDLGRADKQDRGQGLRLRSSHVLRRSTAGCPRSDIKEFSASSRYQTFGAVAASTESTAGDD
jgi:hypothetical protein